MEKNNRRFIDTVAENHDEIKQIFMLTMTAAGLPFDEDMFQETLIKCEMTYKDDTENVEKVKAYFWTAFKTNTIKALSRQKHVEDITTLKEFDLIDDEYICEIDEFVVMVKDELYKEFGKELSDVWLRHSAMGETYGKLEDKCPKQNMHYQFKKIRKYIREELPKKNPRFRELMDTLR